MRLRALCLAWPAFNRSERFNTEIIDEMPSRQATYDV